MGDICLRLLIRDIKILGPVWVWTLPFPFTTENKKKCNTGNWISQKGAKQL